MADGHTAIERAFIEDEIKFFKSGGKLISASGEDLTTEKLKQLAVRLESADKEMSENKAQ